MSKDPLIITLIFVFLYCREKAYDSKNFGCENAKPHHEPQMMTG